jgi:hypothetical protein
VDGVVAAQGVLSGEVAGVAGQWFVDRGDAELSIEFVDRGDGTEVGRVVDAARAGCRSERCASFGVDELAGDQKVGTIPELGREFGPGFVEDQLDQRRRIEVDDQRR